jgi:hypothetical protein
MAGTAHIQGVCYAAHKEDDLTGDQQFSHQTLSHWT